MRKAARLLVSFEVIPVGLFIGLSILSVRLLPAAIGVSLAFWLLRLIVEGHTGKSTCVDWGVALLVLMLGVSLLVTTRLEETAIQAARVLSGVFLFYAIINWVNSLNRGHWLTAGMIVLGIFLALFASFSVVWVTGKLTFLPVQMYEHFELVVGDAVNPNVMAGFLVVILPLPAAFFLFGWKTGRLVERLIMAAAAVPMLGVVLLTQSRGALLALAASVLLLIVLRWRWGFVVVTVGIAAGIAVINQVGGFDELLAALSANPELGGVNGRLEVWSRAIYVVQDFPFTGVGMGNFAQAVDLILPFFSFEPGKISHAHNLFLQIAVDLGIPGLVSWASIYLGVTFGAYKLLRSGQHNLDANRWMMALAVGLCSSQLALAVHGLTDAVTWGQVRAAPIIWGVWGLVIAMQNLQYGSQRGEWFKEKSSEIVSFYLRKLG